MHALTTLLLDHGLQLVFAVTLAARAGVPLPAAPLLVVAGSVAAAASTGLAWAMGSALLVATLANVVGDGLWFAAGRHYGRRITGWLCRFSLSPNSCVVGSETMMQRQGGWALLAAKFVPGVSVVAAPMAGALGMTVRRFVAYDAAASVVWSAVFLGLGAVFSRQVGGVLQALADLGLAAALLVLAVVAGFAAWRWVRRHGGVPSLAGLRSRTGIAAR